MNTKIEEIDGKFIATLEGEMDTAAATFVGASFKPIPQLTCSANYHYLATATKLNRLDRTLGHSIELTASYEFSKDISLTASYTQMHGTETMDCLKQGEGNKRARWAWFSLVISPSLFTTKW